MEDAEWTEANALRASSRFVEGDRLLRYPVADGQVSPS